MKRRNLRIELMCEPILDGCGEGVELKLTGDRVRTARASKSAEVERVAMTITMPRYMVRRLLEQIRAMHERDRERIEREQKRRHTEAYLLSSDYKP